MRTTIYNTPERNKESYFVYYLVAAVAGVVIFFILLGFFKGGFLLIKTIINFLKNYWKHILVGLGAILIARRIFFRRRIRRGEMYQPPM